MQFTGAVPLPGQREPRGQGIGLRAAEGQYDPIGHQLHVYEFAPEYEPAIQGSGLTEPGWHDVPAGQGMHVVALDVLLK